MKKIAMSLILLSGFNSAFAYELTAGLILAPAVTSGGMATTSVCSTRESCRVIVDAKEDALNFLANNQVRGARLQQALDALRAENPSLAISDLELAKLIVIKANEITTN